MAGWFRARPDPLRLTAKGDGQSRAGSARRGRSPTPRPARSAKSAPGRSPVHWGEHATAQATCREGTDRVSRPDSRGAPGRGCRARAGPGRLARAGGGGAIAQAASRDPAGRGPQAFARAVGAGALPRFAPAAAVERGAVRGALLGPGRGLSRRRPAARANTMTGSGARRLQRRHLRPDGALPALGAAARTAKRPRPSADDGGPALRRTGLGQPCRACAKITARGARPGEGRRLPRPAAGDPSRRPPRTLGGPATGRAHGGAGRGRKIVAGAATPSGAGAPNTRARPGPHTVRCPEPLCGAPAPPVPSPPRRCLPRKGQIHVRKERKPGQGEGLDDRRRPCPWRGPSRQGL